MAADNDFNRLIDCLRRGDEDAASEVFHRFARRLIALARSQLDSWIRTRVEPEDVVQSVFRSFFTRFEAGQFQLGNWDNLWTVLTLITIRQCANRLEFWQAAKRDLQRAVRRRRAAHPPPPPSPTRGEGASVLPPPLWGGSSLFSLPHKGGGLGWG
jgi:RNA polymerase sigma-70 factor, ECF subfamily